MKLRRSLAVALVLAPLSLGAKCTPEQTQTVNAVQDAVLSTVNIACVMGSFLDDPQALAAACEFADKVKPLLPVLRGLIGVRNAGRRAGVTYERAAAGAPDAPSSSADAGR